MSKRTDRGERKKLDRHERAAARAINALASFGTSRHDNKGDGKVRSHLTAKQYQQTFKMTSRFLASVKGAHLRNLTTTQAEQYLQHRSYEIQNKQLANERQALQLYLRELHDNPRIELAKYDSTREPPSKAPRAYTRVQVQHTIKHSSDRQKLSTAIAYQAGLRAHELLTIAPLSERPVTYRKEDWHPNKFAGREHWVTYSVVGKGGMPREVKLPPDTALRLEQSRLDNVQPRTDRGVGYHQRYAINGGQSFSTHFTIACRSAIGDSNGPHGLRHSYAQERILECMANGFSEQQAKLIVTQELGHWSTSNIVYYLR